MRTLGRHDRTIAMLAGVIVVFMGIASCGGDEGGNASFAPPPPPPPKIENGTFEVAATVGFNGCNLTTVYSGTYDIEIDSLTFHMGSWTGTWDPYKRTARCETPRHQQSIRQCTTTSWTTINVTFTSQDAFWGTITYRYRVAGDCACCTACQSSWNITGVRAVP